MESFGEFFHRLWLSRLPVQLVYAICTAAIFEALVWLINNYIRKALRPALHRDKGNEPAMRAARMKLLLRPPMLVVRTILYVVAIAIILRLFGLPLRMEVLPILGVVAGAALLACWPLMHDCVRGYVLVYQHAFAVGDEISVGELRGTVVAITLPHTFLRTSDGQEIIIANGRITQLINHSRGAASE
jgi:small conductance mechanosensitive channel